MLTCYLAQLLSIPAKFQPGLKLNEISKKFQFGPESSRDQNFSKFASVTSGGLSKYLEQVLSSPLPSK